MAAAVVIVDYGMGNLHSVEQAFLALGCPVLVSSDLDVVAHAPALVLPGVGHFGRCMENLVRHQLDNVLVEQVEKGVPFLGICLGYQALFEGSEETIGTNGLSLLEGRVVRFSTPELKVPHMGWNCLKIKRASPILSGLADGSYLYFVHSYYPEPKDNEIVVTTTMYGNEFASSIQQENIFACQFHPEKSQRLGLRMLDNFLKFARLRGT